MNWCSWAARSEAVGQLLPPAPSPRRRGGAEEEPLPPTPRSSAVGFPPSPKEAAEKVSQGRGRGTTITPLLRRLAAHVGVEFPDPVDRRRARLVRANGAPGPPPAPLAAGCRFRGLSA